MLYTAALPFVISIALIQAARATHGTEEMNRKALQAGFAAAERVKAAA